VKQATLSTYILKSILHPNCDARVGAVPGIERAEVRRRHAVRIEKIAVLVVEDEPVVRMNIVAELEENGMEVLEAPDAHHAVGVLAQPSG